VQTPQGFRRDVLERAHAVSSDATDDAGLVERLGERVLVVEGDPRALKVTTPGDLEVAARLLAP
jgi:2-C-methyl-D-erythritol 4-phosphate cytidylyltransferase